MCRSAHVYGDIHMAQVWRLRLCCPWRSSCLNRSWKPLIHTLKERKRALGNLQGQRSVTLILVPYQCRHVHRPAHSPTMGRKSAIQKITSHFCTLPLLSLKRAILKPSIHIFPPAMLELSPIGALLTLSSHIRHLSSQPLQHPHYPDCLPEHGGSTFFWNTRYRPKKMTTSKWKSCYKIDFLRQIHVWSSLLIAFWRWRI